MPTTPYAQWHQLIQTSEILSSDHKLLVLYSCLKMVSIEKVNSMWLWFNFRLLITGDTCGSCVILCVYKARMNWCHAPMQRSSGEMQGIPSIFNWRFPLSWVHLTLVLGAPSIAFNNGSLARASYTCFVGCWSGCCRSSCICNLQIAQRCSQKRVFSRW